MRRVSRLCDDRECSGKPRDRASTFELSIVRIGYRKRPRYFVRNETPILILSFRRRSSAPTRRALHDKNAQKNVCVCVLPPTDEERGSSRVFWGTGFLSMDAGTCKKRPFPKTLSRAARCSSFVSQFERFFSLSRLARRGGGSCFTRLKEQVRTSEQFPGHLGPSMFIAGRRRVSCRTVSGLSRIR